MLVRKLYLKLRHYFYLKREFFNKAFLILMFTIFLYAFVNFVVFERIILGLANYDRISNNCKNAVKLYNVAYFYYNINHFSDQNKKIYFRLPYELSLCYLKEKDSQRAKQAMLNGVTNIQNKYGLYSPETAYFIRRYLIDYYLLTNDIAQAQQEFKGLIVIYKKIGYDKNIMADLIRVLGDIYYQKNDYEDAMTYYGKAYNALYREKNIDYEIFSRVVDRICDYEVKNSNTNEAIKLYLSSIQLLKTSGSKQNELTADMLLRLAKLYQQNFTPLKTTIPCYEEAIAIIKTLPRTSYLKQNIRPYLITLKTLYEQNNQYVQAQKMDEELIKQKRLNWFY